MMPQQAPKPLLFTARGLQLTTKGIAIYTVFSAVIAVSKIVTDKMNMNALMPARVLYPMYALLAVYLLVLVVNALSIYKGRYYWVLAILSIIILLGCRFYYIPVANWIYSW